MLFDVPSHPAGLQLFQPPGNGQNRPLILVLSDEDIDYETFQLPHVGYPQLWQQRATQYNVGEEIEQYFLIAADEFETEYHLGLLTEDEADFFNKVTLDQDNVAKAVFQADSRFVIRITAMTVRITRGAQGPGAIETHTVLCVRSKNEQTLKCLFRKLKIPVLAVAVVGPHYHNAEFYSQLTNNEDACDDVIYYIAGETGREGANGIDFLNRYEQTGWSCEGWGQDGETVFAYRRVTIPEE